MLSPSQPFLALSRIAPPHKLMGRSNMWKTAARETMSYGDVMVIEIILKYVSKCLVWFILTFFTGWETKMQISATGNHHFGNIHIPRKWIVVSAHADWLTRRWLARYYSPWHLWIIFKILAASVFHAPALLLIMNFVIIFFKVAVYPWGMKNWRQFLFYNWLGFL